MGSGSEERGVRSWRGTQVSAMSRRRWALVVVLLAGIAVAILVGRELRSTDVFTLYPSRNAFVEQSLPSNTAQELMDIGVADINGDDWLDIFTSNHNTRQYLWVADGKGGYRDMLSEWGLDQDTAFPGVEISEREPAGLWCKPSVVPIKLLDEKWDDCYK